MLNAQSSLSAATQVRLVATRAELELKPLPFPDVSGMSCPCIGIELTCLPCTSVLPGSSYEELAQTLIICSCAILNTRLPWSPRYQR